MSGAAEQDASHAEVVWYCAVYFLLPQSRIPLLEGTDFKQAFEASGRRSSQMDESSEGESSWHTASNFVLMRVPNSTVLFSVILALASRVSDHPLLVGAAAPSIHALSTAVRDGSDLSEFGRRRENACKAMTDKAVRLADSRSIWRKPSIANMASLLLLEGLFDREQPSGVFSKLSDTVSRILRGDERVDRKSVV